MRRLVIPHACEECAKLELDRDTSHYLLDVLRLRKGSKFEAIDSTGACFACTLLAVENGRAFLSLVPLAVRSEERPALDLVLVQGLPKGQKFDLVVRQAVELGASVIIPLITEHCVAQEPPGAAPSKRERRERIIREALQQSGSTVLTRIIETVPLQELDKTLDAQGYDRSSSLRIVFHEHTEMAQASLHSLLVPDINKIVICVGPEGGFSHGDMTIFKELGFAACHLEGPILRTETAAVAALAAVRAIATERHVWKLC
ncbi:MAG: RsmE family RNA methyltransferase [Spirochaetales bacterium]|nr:RsmE family RNA methyltransferase [Spirochaetales bacterium]